MRHFSDGEQLRLWGGVEPTINRVGDRYFRQLERSGHRARLSDLDEFARLGLRTLRFPILWEEIAPDAPDAFDWTSVDAPLQRLRELGIKPIAGLLHHGSGPRYTSLTDECLAEKLAIFARAVAERYPWIDTYTPVNEPLTTARFSGLYGLWFPHGRDQQTFARCVINQCRGVATAMRAIREVNSEAVLVQTDDLGKTYSTPSLQYQANYDNERRWLTWDLLTGTLSRDHLMWSELARAGVRESELAAFQESPCAPDIIGVNHYITSERFLDDNLHAHPPETHGGNEFQRFADVAAVRVRRECIAGTEGVLREAWERYRLPLAVTEAHIGCTREEQLRWFMEVWRGAETLRAEKIDVRAVTAWSLLGAFDWNSLLTRDEGFYETGAYDIRGGSPRPTAIASMVHALAHRREYEHPTLATPGWWRRSVRILPAPPDQPSCISEVSAAETTNDSIARADKLRGQPILITGAAGRLAQGFIRAAELRGLSYRLFSRAELDITDAVAIATEFKTVAPWAVINCAGYSKIDDAETDEQSCTRANVDGAATLAAACARAGAALVTFSSDHVFDGSKDEPYGESDEPCPSNVYGESKLRAERVVLSTHPEALVVRPGKIFAAQERDDFLREQLQTIARGERVRVANDMHFSGTHLPDLVHAALDLLIDGERGIWHLANTGAITPEKLLLTAAEIAQLDGDLIEGTPFWKLNRPAPRPRHRVLRSERGLLLPPIEDALHRYCRDMPEIFRTSERLVATS